MSLERSWRWIHFSEKNNTNPENRNDCARSISAVIAAEMFRRRTFRFGFLSTFFCCRCCCCFQSVLFIRWPPLVSVISLPIRRWDECCNLRFNIMNFKNLINLILSWKYRINMTGWSRSLQANLTDAFYHVFPPSSLEFSRFSFSLEFFFHSKNCSSEYFTFWICLFLFDVVPAPLFGF